MTSNQLACPCCKASLCQTSLIIGIRELELLAGFNLEITSGYRCRKHNAAVKGAPNSQHMLGLAVDIVRPRSLIDPKALASFWILGQKCGFRGLGIGETFLHLDQRKTLAVWKYGKGNKTFPASV